MRLIYLLLTFLLFNTNENAQLLAMYQKMRTIREKNKEIHIIDTCKICVEQKWTVDKQIKRNIIILE